MKDRVVLYLRVSSDGQSTDRQKSDLTQWCSNNNMEVIKIFSENVSGLKDTKDRPELTNLIDYVSDKSNKIDGVACTEISRLGRRLADVSVNIELFNRLGIYVVSSTGGIAQKTLNSDKSVNIIGGFLVNIMSSVANLEREQIINRTRSGIKKSVLDGNSNSGKYKSYGFDVVDKKYVIVEDEAKIVRLIFDLYLQGMGTQKIANYLNDKKIKTRFQLINATKKVNNKDEYRTSFSWANGTIYKILTNRIYIGEKRFDEKENGIIIKTHIIKQPQIIDNETFDKVNELLKSNKSKLGKNAKFEYVIDNDIIKCGICGLNYLPHKRLNRNDSVYRCLSTRTILDKCGNTSIGIDKLSSSVWYFLRRSDELKNSLSKSVKNNNIQNDIKQKVVQLVSFEKELIILNKDEKKVLDLYMENLLSKELYTTKYNKIQNDKEQLKKNKLKLQKDIDKLKFIENKQSDLNEMLKTIKSTPEMMKNLVTELVDKIVIYPVKSDLVLYENKPNNYDKQVLVSLFLYTNDKPINYIISKRTNNIIRVIEGEYNFKNYTITGSPILMRKRMNQIQLDIKVGLK